MIDLFAGFSEIQVPRRIDTLEMFHGFSNGVTMPGNCHKNRSEVYVGTGGFHMPGSSHHSRSIGLKHHHASHLQPSLAKRTTNRLRACICGGTMQVLRRRGETQDGLWRLFIPNVKGR